MNKSYSITTEFARNTAVQAIMGLDVSKPHNVVISPVKRSRTAAQNGLYFHWVGCVANHVGDDKESMHGQLKAMFLMPVFCRDDEDYAALHAAVVDACRRGDGSGNAMRALKAATSITRASQEQMSEYLDEIKRMCAGQGIHLTVPDHWKWLGI